MTYAEIYENFRAETLKRFKELNDFVQQCDNAEQDFLHFLENESCDAVKMVIIAKKLKELRIQRRVAKDELIWVQSLRDTLVVGKAKKVDKLRENGTGVAYKYRTDALSSIAARPKGYIIKCAKKMSDN